VQQIKLDLEQNFQVNNLSIFDIESNINFSNASESPLNTTVHDEKNEKDELLNNRFKLISKVDETLPLKKSFWDHYNINNNIVIKNKSIVAINDNNNSELFVLNFDKKTLCYKKYENFLQSFYSGLEVYKKNEKKNQFNLMVRFCVDYFYLLLLLIIIIIIIIIHNYYLFYKFIFIKITKVSAFIFYYI
jgi:hypothetical protein